MVDGPEYTPVAFALQSSTWMRASSSIGSWASGGECGGTASSASRCWPLPERVALGDPLLHWSFCRAVSQGLLQL